MTDEKKKKETAEEPEEAPEFETVSLENLTEKFSGDAAKAEAVFLEISALGQFGIIHVSSHAVLGVNTATPKMQAKIRALIEERAAEKKPAEKSSEAQVADVPADKTPVSKKPKKAEGHHKAPVKKVAPRGRKAKTDR